MAATIEERVTNLEQEVAELKRCSSEKPAEAPWWEKIRGTFKDDPIYDEAMELGREWRASQPMADAERE
jgi:hypothetical protein